jgi:putative endopeptidase
MRQPRALRGTTPFVRFRPVFVVAFAFTAGCGGGPPPLTSGGAPPPRLPGPTSRTEPLVTPMSLADVGLDGTLLDATAPPCADFYRYACGGFAKHTPLGDDESVLVRGESFVRRAHREALRKVLEAKLDGAARDVVSNRLRGFYGACLDQDAVEERGLKPILPLLMKTLKIKDARGAGAVLGELHGAGIRAFFSLGTARATGERARLTLALRAPTLGLGTAARYLATGAPAEAARDRYVEHVGRVMKLVGLSEKAARQAGLDVLAVETELARGLAAQGAPSLVSVGDLDTQAPRFPWSSYLRALGMPSVSEVRVDSPGLVPALGAAFAATRAPAWSSYLTWSLVAELSPALPKVFRDAARERARDLGGPPGEPPRWSECIDATSEALPALADEALLVRRPEAERKAAAERIVGELGNTLAALLASAPGSDGAAKERDKGRLAGLGLFVGHAGHGAEDDVAVGPRSHADNVLAARRAKVARTLARLGGAPDAAAWPDGAFGFEVRYDAGEHLLVVPGAVLEPPLYDAKAPLSAHLGGLGSRIAAALVEPLAGELGGAERGACVASVAGRFGAKEASAARARRDVAALELALGTFRRLRDGAAEVLVAEGLSEEQQLFVAYAQSLCTVARDPGIAAAQAASVNGTLAALPAFAGAFRCADDAPMSAPAVCASPKSP